jgi:hypothetical protein
LDVITDTETASGESTASESAESILVRLRDMAIDRIKKDPLLSAGIAAAAGFALGGGLASGTFLRAVKRSVMLGLQIIVIPTLVGRLRDLMSDAVEDEE